jgi:hypothetical protein
LFVVRCFNQLHDLFVFGAGCIDSYQVFFCDPVPVETAT